MFLDERFLSRQSNTRLLIKGRKMARLGQPYFPTIWNVWTTGYQLFMKKPWKLIYKVHLFYGGPKYWIGLTFKLSSLSSTLIWNIKHFGRVVFSRYFFYEIRNTIIMHVGCHTAWPHHAMNEALIYSFHESLTIARQLLPLIYFK